MIFLKNHCYFNSHDADDLVCVITHKRKDFISKWLRAWNNAEHYGAKIAVIHAVDEIEPNKEEKENILKYNPDFYVPFKNSELRDLAGLIGVCKNLFDLPDWKRLYWFTDDMLPMRKIFLRPFVEKIKKSNAGLVAQCYEPKTLQNTGGHIRTVAYAITREVANNLKFPEVGMPQQRGHLFEHGIQNLYEDHILKQVTDMGYEFELCHSKAEADNYQHWTSFLDWMWDCHLLGSWEEYWDVYEQQFSPIQKFENVNTCLETMLTQDQCEAYFSIPNKVCAIIPTSEAPINCLLWSVFSLLLNSSPEVLEHFIVGINGPDKRTGNPELQDKKQNFLEELRDMKWHGKDMPITVMRTWSRIGHAQTLEQAIPWVHTENYLSMHDDVIILNKKWQNEALEFFDNKDEIMKTFEFFMYGSLSGGESSGRSLRFPHVNSVFSLCRKPLMKEIGACWIGYHIPLEFYIGNFVNYEQFINFHKKHRSIDTSHNIPQKDKKYELISMDIGTFVINKILKNGCKTSQFSNDVVKHFSAGSWGNGLNIISQIHQEVLDLEEKLKEIPEFYNLYLKYKTD
jgi:hypothetical protein